MAGQDRRTSEQDMVTATVRDVLSSHEPFALTPDRPWDPALWAALAGAGLTGVGLAEEAGGSGGELADAVAVVAALARGAGAVPVAEQLLVAGPAVLAAGLDLPPVEDPLTLALHGVLAEPAGQGWTFAGTAIDVPWAAVASAAAVVAQGPDGPLLAVVPLSSATVQPVASLAGEPHGSVTLDRVTVAQAAPMTDAQVALMRSRFALARAVQLAAAMEQVLAWTVQHAGEREQFGRPLSRFQAIQMELAEMAGEVTAVTALVDAAVQVLACSADVELAAAAAKVRAGSAVEVVARLAHQVHGAIGFTQEHRLHHLTRRCWSWRDEAGSELAWSHSLGAALVASGPDGLWPALTRVV